MQKVNAHSPSSIPFLQRFLTIDKRFTSGLKSNCCQMETGKKGFVVLVWILDDKAWQLRGQGRMSRRGMRPLRTTGPRVTFDTARLRQIFAECR